VLRLRHLFVSFATLHALVSSAAEPLTTRTDAVGSSLNQWAADGTAAGFDALQYENHDGGHSPLPPSLYPGLRHLRHSKAEIKAGQDKGPATQLREIPTVGNCSMSAPPTDLGSIPRMYMMDTAGYDFLARQYLGNQLFVYPEHLDYDPGANGVGGYGDLYPANSPCPLISQGSSNSDMPFVKAMLATAAAFRPTLQKQLIAQRILSPTLQAIFRQNSTLVQTDADYLTGKAHPPVFDASAIDELKMVTAAQIMSDLSIPPLAFLQVLSERQSTSGKDWFEPPAIRSEALGTTPSFISRVFRSSAEVYRLRLSAAKSVDTEKRTLVYIWKLLQGDHSLVKITPNEVGDEADVEVRWHPPMSAASGIRTHRVDIGLFVRSPLAISAPAILSIAMLPNEMRFFNGVGKLTEVCYEAGNPELGLPASDADIRWLAFVEAAAVGKPVISASLQSVLSPAQLERLKGLWEQFKDQKSVVDVLRSDPARKEQADAERIKLGTALGKAFVPPLREAARTALLALADQPNLFLRQQADILALASSSTGLTELRAELKRLTNLGVLIEQANGTFATQHSADMLTTADRYYLRQLHLTVLSHVLLAGFLQRSAAPLFVDQRLSTPKAWRDVYRYTSTGERDGWVRHHQGRTYRFDQDGHLLAEGSGAQTVNYRLQDAHLVFDAAPPGGK